MRGLFANKTLTLQPGQIVSGIAKGAQTLHITHGRVWITVEDIEDDYFLHAGDTFTAIPGRLVVLEAEEDAKVDNHRLAARRPLRDIPLVIAQIAQRLARSATA